MDKLYKHIPKNAHVVCYDEFGPIEVRPIHGRTWGVQGSPTRLPATYTRTLGTRQYLAFYDLRHDKLWGYFNTRKRWMEVLQALNGCDPCIRQMNESILCLIIFPRINA